MSGERDLRKRLAALERKFATLALVGTVEANQGAKSKVRFDDYGADGKPFSSPFLHQASHAGHEGQGVASFTKLGTGTPVLVISPGGELGAHSRIMPFGPTDDRPSPGSSEADGQVMRFGDAKIAVRDDGVRIEKAGQSVHLKADGSMAITTAGALTVTGSTITLDGPVAMPKGFTAGDGDATGGLINGPLNTTRDITSQTRVAAPVLQGALIGA